MHYNGSNNAARSAALKAAANEKGGKFTIWLTRDFTAQEARLAVENSQAEGFLAEAEIPSELGDGEPNPQAQDWVGLIAELEPLPIRKGVVTNFAPFVHSRTDVPEEDERYKGKPWPEKARPLVDAGWRCLTEAYDLSGDPAQWPARRAFYASHLGWTITQPVLGIYPSAGGAGSVDAFPTRNQYPNWSVWDAGHI